MGKDVGVHGNLFGGTMLAWLDEAGAIFAMQTAKSDKVVTLKVSDVRFRQPVRANDVVMIYGTCLKVGSPTISIQLTVKRKNMVNFEEQTVCEADMVFVNVNENGKPTPIKKE